MTGLQPLLSIRRFVTMKYFGISLMAILLGCWSAAQGIQSVNYVAAVVNDAVITYQDVMMQAMTSMGRRNPRRYQEAQEFDKVRADSLELLIERQLILQDGRNAGINLPESLIEDQIKVRIREKYGEYGDRATLTKELQAQGMTYEAFRQRMRDDIISYIMRQRNVSSAIIISPAKIEGYYREHQTNYNIGDQVRLRVIVLNVPAVNAAADVRKLALEIVRKIEAGIPFGEMASVYSEGSAQKEGGDWGWHERSFFKKGLADIAFSLKPGLPSGLIGVSREADDFYWVFQYNPAGLPILTRKYSGDKDLVEEKKLDGAAEAMKDLPEPHEYYLMLVEEKRPAHLKPLVEVQEDIEKELISKERIRLEKKWIDRLKAKAYVRYY